MEFKLVLDKNHLCEYLKKEDLFEEFREDPKLEFNDAWIFTHHPYYWFAMYNDDNEMIGLSLVQALRPTLADIHIAIYKKYRKDGIQYATAGLNFLKENTNLKQLMGFIPRFKRHVYYFAKRLGFKRVSQTEKYYIVSKVL